MEATDYVTVERSSLWSYIWRSLVIVTILHLLFYVYGLLKNKYRVHPTGLFVLCSASGDPSDNASGSIVGRLNQTFWEKHGLKITGFFLPTIIPGLLRGPKPWYVQGERKFSGAKVTVCFPADASRGSRMRVDFGKVWYDLDDSMLSMAINSGVSGTAASDFDLYRRKLKKKPPAASDPPFPSKKIKVEDVRGFYQKSIGVSNAFDSGVMLPLATCLGRFDSDDNLTSVLFFIKQG